LFTITVKRREHSSLIVVRWLVRTGCLPAALDNRSPRKLLAAVVRKLIASLRRS
jgi:hypothetical protein